MKHHGKLLVDIRKLWVDIHKKNMKKYFGNCLYMGTIGEAQEVSRGPIRNWDWKTYQGFIHTTRGEWGFIHGTRSEGAVGVRVLSGVYMGHQR